MRQLLVGCALVAGAAEAARADDRGANPVRATVTVEVIDDARQVDDIIARVKAQRESEQGEKRAATKLIEPRDPRAERLPLPRSQALEVRESDPKRTAKPRERVERERPNHPRPRR